MSNKTTEEIRPQLNPNSFSDLSFERDVNEWSQISMGINLLLSYGLQAMAKDDALSDIFNSECLQSLNFLKSEIDKSIIYTLTVITE